jgi:hypothetical protein
LCCADAGWGFRRVDQEKESKQMGAAAQNLSLCLRCVKIISNTVRCLVRCGFESPSQAGKSQWHMVHEFHGLADIGYAKRSKSNVQVLIRQEKPVSGVASTNIIGLHRPLIHRGITRLRNLRRNVLVRLACKTQAISSGVQEFQEASKLLLPLSLRLPQTSQLLQARLTR